MRFGVGIRRAVQGVFETPRYNALPC
jgi:hypothetical protein